MPQWLWELKWGLVFAIIAGLIVAYFSHQDNERIDRILTQGAAFSAYAESIEQRTSRGVSFYSLHAAWSDAYGRHYQRDFNISDKYAERVIVGDHIIVGRVTIKYLASEDQQPMVLMEDAENEKSANRLYIWLGLIAAVVGAIAAPIVFWAEHRHAKAEKDDIEATLAKIRAEASNM